jgi:chaperone BCS1
VSSAHAVPILEEVEIAQLAKCFADAITEGELSIRTGFSPLSRLVLVSHTQGIGGRWLQGYMLKNKTRPRECVEEVAEWCEAVI